MPVFVFIYTASQLTDLFDGMAARKYNETSDFGKFFDPFADTLMQLTCFFAFIIGGFFNGIFFGFIPWLLFLLVIYREFAILLIRNLMMKKGITMGARMSGKVKTVGYIITGGFVLFTVTLKRLGEQFILLENSLKAVGEFFIFIYPYVNIFTIVIFFASVVISVVSFFDYLSAYKKSGQEKQ